MILTASPSGARQASLLTSGWDTAVLLSHTFALRMCQSPGTVKPCRPNLTSFHFLRWWQKLAEKLNPFFGKHICFTFCDLHPRSNNKSALLHFPEPQRVCELISLPIRNSKSCVAFMKGVSDQPGSYKIEWWIYWKYIYTHLPLVCGH